MLLKQSAIAYLVLALGCGVSEPQWGTLAGGKSDGLADLRTWFKGDRGVIQTCALEAPDIDVAPGWQSVESLSFQGWERFQRCKVWAREPVGVVRVAIDTFGTFKPILRVDQKHASMGVPAWIEPPLVETAEGHALYQITLVVWPHFRASQGFVDIDVTSAALTRHLPGNPERGVGSGLHFRIALQQIPGRRINGPFDLTVDNTTRRVEAFAPGDPADGQHQPLHYGDHVNVRFDFGEPLLVTRLRWQFPLAPGSGNLQYSREHHLPYLQWSDSQPRVAGLVNLPHAYNWAIGQVTSRLDIAIRNILDVREKGEPPVRDIGFDGIELLAVSPAALAGAVDLRGVQVVRGSNRPPEAIQ